MSGSERKLFQSISCPTGLLDILIYFIFDIILCVLVEFHQRGHFVMSIMRKVNLIYVHFWTFLTAQALFGLVTQSSPRERVTGPKKVLVIDFLLETPTWEFYNFKRRLRFSLLRKIPPVNIPFLLRYLFVQVFPSIVASHTGLFRAHRALVGENCVTSAWRPLRKPAWEADTHCVTVTRLSKACWAKGGQMIRRDV